MRRYILFFIFLLFSLILPVLPKTAWASSLSINPPNGNFAVGSTFDVSVVLDTKGKSINALQIFLSFPPDKLQVISPSAGQSIVDVWTAPPEFNNILGTVKLEGGIPGGIITSKGILTTITFRVKSTGGAFIKFLDKSRVLLNDGLATDNLGQIDNAFYDLKLPPPQGPLVISDTHSNQSVWYSNKNAVLRFVSNFSVDGYSYILNNDPNTNPDNISEGNRTSVTYSNLSDGVHYFHIKSLRDGVWGGITHFALKVDTVPPADFPIEISPSKYTTSTKPVIQFTTTDKDSGVDHYELKLEPLSIGAIKEYQSGSNNFFIESVSPYITTPLTIGSYDVIIRAYDRANNYKEIKDRLTITTPLFQFIGSQGIIIKNSIIISWQWVWTLSFLILLVLCALAYKAWGWHQVAHIIRQDRKLPEDVAKKLQELKEYQKKYGVKILAIVLIIASSMLFHSSVNAQTREISPPIIDTISKDISNRDIFYIGGKTSAIDETVIIYLQNLITGETTSQNADSDKKGYWFYRHNAFLSPGNYLLWTQSKHGEELSPPSSQITMTVKQTAIEFGSNRLNYETIYLFAVIILILVVGGLIVFIILHTYRGRKKYQQFKEEVKKVENSIHVGFAMLQRDIEAELAAVNQVKLTGTFGEEEKKKETQLLTDLENISKRIEKEIAYIETIEEKTQQ